MPRVRQYVGAEGEVLGVREARGYYTLTWFLNGDYGADVGEGGRPSDEEARTLHDALLDFCEAHPDTSSKQTSGRPFTFEDERTAKAALRVANTTLLNWRDKVPTPEWAKTALAEGWKPPKGWKPKGGT